LTRSVTIGLTDGGEVKVYTDGSAVPSETDSGSAAPPGE